MKSRILGCALAMALFSVIPSTRAQEHKIPLRDGWTIQSSAKVSDTGEKISTPGYKTQDWLPATVPTTVVGTQVKQAILPDPGYGMNLRQFPGVNYPIGANFSPIPMPADSPYVVPWWYRKSFALPKDYQGKTVWLKFAGINYRANIFLNGKQIANSDVVVGAWRTFEFDVTDAAHVGENVLAIEVWAPKENDLAITFVDWNPAPPDKNMGLFREVYLTASGPVAIRYPAVSAKVDSPANDQAHLMVQALLKNAGKQAVKGTLKGKIEEISFSQPVELAPGESKNVTFTPEQFPQLNLRKPRLWWPAQMGKPELYELTLTFDLDGKTTDVTKTNFGIREIRSDVQSNGEGRFRRVFQVNGKNILIRGGGWTPDLLLRENQTRMQDEFRYVRDMGLNTVRLEGKLEPDQFFDTADREGILVMAGWCCCDFWEQWSKWQDTHMAIAKASLQDQIYRLRSHPSLLIWLNGSDNPPPANVEDMYLQVEKELQWPNPVTSSATSTPTTLTGETGGKMSGPYEYIAPSYWVSDPHQPAATQKCSSAGCGGAYGFNTETSMGPAVPVIDSIQRMLPKDHLWPIDDFWNYHAGGGEFKTLQVFSDALDARYGKANSAADYSFKSQLMTYEGVRAMFEAYSRNKYTSTGVIQWMLNNAWPSMIWHLYDYYLQPGGGYFGAKKGLQALAPVYGYDDHSVWLVSSRYADTKGLQLSVRVLNLDATEVFSKKVAVEMPADSTARVLELPQPELDKASPAYFLDLRITDAAGNLVGSNFYWLSKKPETFDWANSTWFKTPTKDYADYTSLAGLPKVRLDVKKRTEPQGANTVERITLRNPGKNIAFFVRLKLAKSNRGDEILPVLWSDNYITLLPGETRELSATYRTSDAGKGSPALELQGWNVHTQ